MSEREREPGKPNENWDELIMIARHDTDQARQGKGQGERSRRRRRKRTLGATLAAVAACLADHQRLGSAKEREIMGNVL